MVQTSLAHLLLLLPSVILMASGYLQPSSVGSRGSLASSRLRAAVAANDASTSKTTTAKGFGKHQTVAEVDVPDANDYYTNKPLNEVKQELLALLPRMTGQADEFRQVEQMVNALEAQYVPAQTLAFLNLAMQGSWQLLFSTNLAGTPNPLKFRLRELIQRIECRKLEGSITNTAVWDLADENANFECTGDFSVQCSYTINQGARMVVAVTDHILRPATGSPIPANVPALVGLLHRAIPKELFDPADHAVDTTYLDADLRIVRYTGPRLEGVRDIFIRQGALEIHPE
jgi:PAP_fibrillin